MKDSQLAFVVGDDVDKYIKANNERFSTPEKNLHLFL